MSSRVRTITTVVIAVLLVAALVAPALAHAQLVGSTPENGGTLGTTDRVTLTFNEDINPDFVQVVVTGPDGDVGAGDPTVEGPLVTQPVEPTGSGSYSAVYRVVSADGHPVSGEVRFTLTDVPDPEPSPTTTTDAPTTAPTTADVDSRTATPEAMALEDSQDTASGSSWPVAWAVAAVVLLAGAALTAGVLRRRHQAT
jgi:copper resistance protein C